VTFVTGKVVTFLTGLYNACQNLLDKSLFVLVREVTSIVAGEWLRRRSQSPAQLVRVAGQGSENIQFNSEEGLNLLGLLF
jgi:uncharacterized membrane protein YiaA